MAGVTAGRDGVPVLAEMLDGNQSDKTWHSDVLKHVTRRLRIPNGRPVHYVGDSALITAANLDIAQSHGLALTGRLPRTVKMCDSLVSEALASESWEALGTFSPAKGAASYEGQKFVREILGHELQVGVYRSSDPDERVAKRVRGQQAGAQEKVRREAKLLCKRTFGCREDAEAALAGLSSAHRAELLIISGTVEERTVTEKRERRGRPKANEVRASRTEIGLAIDVALDTKRAEQAIRDEGCFVLVHSGKETMTLRELLEEYKGQSVVETRFPFLKDAALADVFFVKLPKRVEALGYVMLFALLLWSVWERRVRRALKASGEKPLRDVTGMSKTRPTAMVCVHIMKGVRVARHRAGSEFSRWELLENPTTEQARVQRFSQVSQLFAPAP